MYTENEKIIDSSITQIMQSAYIDYSMSVIVSRALPDVRDGLKPVQRRVLYAMLREGLLHNRAFDKCAGVIGEVLKNYHPHGDSSVYDTLTRLAQDWVMRYPLVIPQGNFGSIEGDSPAAYRYTECKLAEIAEDLLTDIDSDTVDFMPNYKETTSEPTVLPSALPTLLMNGSTGIAVGMTTNIPPHNLGEVINGTVAYIDNPKISLKEMMKFIPAPDFPTGGYIMADGELEEAYKTGRGKIKIRARVNIEKDTGDKQNLVITELPYQVNKAELLKKISEMRDERRDKLGDIADVVDESDRNGMRAVIKLRKEANAAAILKYLYKTTALETSYGINMVAIAGGKPCQMGLLSIIGYYVDYQRDVVLRRCKFELERAKERAHILEGLIIAVKNIDEVVRIIKTADDTADARAKLRARFSLSEVQANAILDLRLARLTKLEVEKLQAELEMLKKRIAELTEIIASKAKQMEVVKKELLDIKRRYKDERRSSIMRGGEEVDSEDLEEPSKPVENMVIAFTEGKMFKKMTERSFEAGERTVKENSNTADFLRIAVRAKSNQTVIAFTNLGNCCKFSLESVSECRFREKGSKFSEVAADVRKNEYPVAMFAVDADKLPEGNLLFFTKNGLIKKTDWQEYNLVKSYYQAIKLKENDELISVEQDRAETTIGYVTAGGMVLNAVKDDIPVQGRVAGGVRGINLGSGDKIVFVSQIDDEGEFIIVTDTGFYKRVLSSEIKPVGRYGKGIKICELGSVNKIVYADMVKEPFDFAVADNFGVVFKVNTEDISIESRTTKGKTLKNENKKRHPETVYKIL